MYRLCDQSLAGTGFTLQQDGGVAGCDNVDLLQDGLDGDAVTDDGMGMVVTCPLIRLSLGETGISSADFSCVMSTSSPRASLALTRFKSPMISGVK